MKWPWRKPQMTVEQAVGDQLKALMRQGVNGPFQAGYVCALYWTWEQAGLPHWLSIDKRDKSYNQQK